jgi:hypothetical protein
MAKHTYEGIVAKMKVTLVDGYLPSRDFLHKSAEAVAKEIQNLPESKRHSFRDQVYRLNDWDKDDLFEDIAFNTRTLYCMNEPIGCARYIHSEAWLLKPEKWEDGYVLKNITNDQTDRRLLVELYKGCTSGDQCLTNLVEKTGFEIIAESEYKNIKRFRENAENLLDDISLPFRAPYMISEEKITEHNYDFRTFGK